MRLRHQFGRTDCQEPSVLVVVVVVVVLVIVGASLAGERKKGRQIHRLE